MRRWPTVSATRLVEVLLAASVLLIIAILTSGLMPMSKRDVPELPTIVDAMAALTLLCCIAWTINALRFARPPRDRRLQHAGRLALILLFGNQAMALPVTVFALVSLERIERLAPPEEVAEVLSLVSGKRNLRLVRPELVATMISERNVRKMGECILGFDSEEDTEGGEYDSKRSGYDPFECANASGSYERLDSGHPHVAEELWRPRLQQIGVEYAGEVLEFPRSTMWSVVDLYERMSQCKQTLIELSPSRRLECQVLTTGYSCKSASAAFEVVHYCEPSESCITYTTASPELEAMQVADACRYAELESTELRRYLLVLSNVVRSAARLTYLHPRSPGSGQVLRTLTLVGLVVLTASLVMEILTAAGVSTGLLMLAIVTAVIIGSYALCGSLGVVFTPGHVAMSAGALFALCLTLLLAVRIFPRLYRPAYANLALAAWATTPLIVWQALRHKPYFRERNTLDALGWRYLDGRLLVILVVVVLIVVSIAVVAGVRAVDREIFSRPR